MGGKNITVEEVMSDIFSAFGNNTLREGEFTIGMYARHNNISNTQAEDQIIAAIKAGTIADVSRPIIYNGKRVTHVYRKAE